MRHFFKILEVITRRRTERSKMSVMHNGKTSQDELEALARLTARAIRPEIEFAPPGEKLNIITTSDIDDKAGGSGESK